MLGFGLAAVLFEGGVQFCVSELGLGVGLAIMLGERGVGFGLSMLGVGSGLSITSSMDHVLLSFELGHFSQSISSISWAKSDSVGVWGWGWGSSKGW